MRNRPIPAQLVADYFLASVDCEAGDNVTNLKLQKLLYYAQGFHVAMHGGSALFPDSIVAWKHGPVVRQIYHEYKNYRWQAIDRPAKFDINEYAPEVRELLDAVYLIYGQFSATALEHMTHNEPPWKNTPSNRVITLEVLGDFFSVLTDAGREGRPIDRHPVWPTNSFRFQRRRAISEQMEPHRTRLRAIASRMKAGRLSHDD